MFSKILFVAVLVLGVYLSVSYNGAEASLMCYSCNVSSACNDPVNTNNLKMQNCSNSEKCAMFSYLNNSNTVTWRGCSNVTCEALNSTYTNSSVPLTDCTLCNKDHCNSATNFGIPLVVLISAFLAVKFAS